MKVPGKVAFITGVASGYGKEFTLRLLRDGCKVFGVDINETLGRKFEQDCVVKYGSENIKFAKCDVANHHQLKDLFYEAKDTFKSLHIICNNAGIMDITHHEIIESKERDVAKKMLDVNLKSVIEGTYIGLDIMGKSKGGDGGVIVNTASIGGLHAMPLSPIYTAVKHGVVSFTHCFKFLESDGVRVNCICPSITETPMMTNVGWFAESLKKKKTPLTDIADVVTAFIRSIEDESLNGDALAVLAGSKIIKYDFRPSVNELLNR